MLCTSSISSKSSSFHGPLVLESVVRSFSTEEARELSLETSMEESSSSPLPGIRGRRRLLLVSS